jgi:hypothetical protein
MQSVFIEAERLADRSNRRGTQTVKHLEHAKRIETLYDKLKADGASSAALGHLWRAALTLRQMHHTDEPPKIAVVTETPEGTGGS